MHILIVQSCCDLGQLWKRHLERQGCAVSLVQGQDAAADVLRNRDVQAIVLDVEIAEGSALAVADFASYRRPKARVIFVTRRSFFSDGSIFNLAANACAYLPAATPPEDLAVMVEYHATAAL
ncbi:hypothetical protein R3X27_11510 [Tropicimonas sp. TH_r6]|uniref:hypothetical protein n=1 Tax=Tropicimonas sp. TH_r6 TaxID=3082085 RepID=UPI002952A1DA|nr:hypothetical protein [Tropicimonas sp. TH_r6]MDV7143310.1 hypothetical protein [Tropicimonas sp. TH_r6]